MSEVTKISLLCKISFAICLLCCSFVPLKSAYAIAEPVGDAYGLLPYIAAEAGLPVDEVVPTFAGALAVGTGMSVANEVGIHYGQTAAQSLNHLLQAADYPDWNLLTDAQRTNWGTKQNYDAAKFNSLLGAFGLSDGVNRYYEFTESGGGTWDADWTVEEKRKLQQLGRIGSRWALGLPVIADDIIESITHSDYLANWFPPLSYYANKKENDTLWPSNVSSTIPITKTNQFEVTYNGRVSYGLSTNVVNVIYLVGTDVNSAWTIWFDKSPFNAYYHNKDNYVPDLEAMERTVNGITYYYRPYGTKWDAISLPSSTYSGNTLTTSNVENLIAAIYGAGIESSGGASEMSEYPENQEDIADEETYYPQDGLTKNTTWNNFLTPWTTLPQTGDLTEIIALLRQFKFYTTGQLKVHDEGVYDSLTDIGNDVHTIAELLENGDNQTLIGNFDFPEFEAKSQVLEEDLSELFPFGAVWLVSHTVESISDVAVISQPKITIPFEFGGADEDILIDISWINDGRPLINFFMITMLILSLGVTTYKFIRSEV